MNISKIIVGILMFAIVTVVIYVWGLKRQLSKTQDLMNLLFSTGVSRLNKYMKKNDSVTTEEVEKLMIGMSVKLPFSSERSVVTDPKDFTAKLLEYMVKTGQLVKRQGKYYRDN